MAKRPSCLKMQSIKNIARGGWSRVGKGEKIKERQSVEWWSCVG